MRRIGFGIALLTTVCMLSGCGSSKVELTNEQNDMIAEYIAGALLRYDMRYEEELVYTFDEEIEDPEAAERPETPAPVETEVPPVETEAPGQSGETTAPEVTYSGLNDVMKLDGLEVAYKGGGFYNSYPEENSDYFVIEPGVSNQLLVAEFELSNTSAEEKKVDLTEAGITYFLKAGGEEYKPLLTALPNDLRYLTAEVEAGKAKTVVVVFEVKKDVSLTEAELIISRDGQMAHIKPL